MLIIANDDQPGVIGEVGTILGRHGVNIANFALGRGDTGRDRRRQRRRGRRRTHGRSTARSKSCDGRGDPRGLGGQTEHLKNCTWSSCALAIQLNLIHGDHPQRARMHRARERASRPPPARRRRETSSARSASIVTSRMRLDRAAADARSTVPLNSRGSWHDRRRAASAPRPPPDRAAHRRRARRRDARAVAELRGVGDRHQHARVRRSSCRRW